MTNPTWTGHLHVTIEIPPDGILLHWLDDGHVEIWTGPEAQRQMRRIRDQEGLASMTYQAFGLKP